MSNDITIVSSTDSAEQIAEAMAVPAAAAAATPATTPATTPAADPAAPATTPASQATPAADPAAATTETPAAETLDANATPLQKAQAAAKSASQRRQEKIQRDIDANIAKKRDAERAAEAEEARVAQLRADAAALTAEIALKRATASGAPAGAAAPTDPGQPADLNADGTPRYKNYEEWTIAVAKHSAHEAEQKLEAYKKETEQAERTRIERAQLTRAEMNALASYDANLETFKKSTPDYDAVVTASQPAMQEIVDDLGDKAFNVIDRFTLHDADNGSAIVYHLAQHPEEARKIAQLPVPQQLAALGRLDARLTPASPSSPAQAPRPAVSRAPEPITPVGGSPTSSSTPTEEESYQAYKARRTAEEKAAQGR